MSGASADCGYGRGVSAARREALRAFGARLSAHPEVTGCGRKYTKGRVGSSSEILDVTKSCRFKWLCPTCGYAASWQQARDVKRRLLSWTAGGGAAALLTLTQSHCYSDGLAVLWSRMDAGWAALVRGSGWIADKQTHGIRGYIRFTEVVHSPVTGWNVHFHVILLLDRQLDQPRQNGLRVSIAERFANGVARSGGGAAADCQHLQAISPGTEGAQAAYCCKGTKIDTSYDGSRTPMALLDDLESTGEGHALWEEWTGVVLGKGRRQVSPSAGIEKLRPERSLP
jgi:hypothetical protein